MELENTTTELNRFCSYLFYDTAKNSTEMVPKYAYFDDRLGEWVIEEVHVRNAKNTQ